MDRDDGASVALLDSAGTPYCYGDRPKRDAGWARALAVLVALCAVGGVAAFVSANPAFFDLLVSDAFKSDPKSCPLPANGRGWVLPNLGLTAADPSPSPSSKDAAVAAAMLRLARVGSLIVLSSIAAAAGLAVGLIAAFRRHAPLMTAAVVQLQVVVPAVAAAGALASGAWGAAVAFALLAALAAWVIRRWRAQIGLCARLLGLAAQAVADVPGVVGAAAITAVGGAVGAGTLCAVAVAAAATGRVVPNPAVASSAAKGCVNAAGQAVPCCAWVPSLWAVPLVPLSLLAALWVATTAGQARTYVIGGAAVQWWFAPRVEEAVAASARPAALPAPLLVGATRRSASHAAGPSAGSLAMGGAVMTGASVVQGLIHAASAAVDADGPAGQRFLAALAGSIGDAAMEVLSVLTRYATIGAAVTGAGLVESGRAATRLLSSLALTTLGVWWVPPTVLGAYTALLAVVWGAGAGGLWAFTAPPAAHGVTPDDYAETVLGTAVLVGMLSGAVVAAATAFAAGVLLSTTEALYFAWALDRAGTATPARADAAGVFLAVPCGVVVEQPDGGLAYGAGGGGGGAAAGRRRYVPPSQLPAGVPGRPLGEGGV